MRQVSKILEVGTEHLKGAANAKQLEVGQFQVLMGEMHGLTADVCERLDQTNELLAKLLDARLTLSRKQD